MKRLLRANTVNNKSYIVVAISEKLIWEKLCCGSAWESLSKELIQESFGSCAINFATYRSQDDEITCLKESKPCHEGRKLLSELFQLINTEEPIAFGVDEADVDSANPEILTVEEDNDNIERFTMYVI